MKVTRCFRRLLACVFGLLSVLAVHAADSALPIPDRAHYFFQEVGQGQGLGTISPSCLLQDLQGYLWIGTRNGLLRFDGSKVKKFGRDEGLPGVVILQLQISRSGKLWVATDAGVAVFTGIGFRKVTLPDVESLTVRQAIAVSRDQVYVATSEGLLAIPNDQSTQASLWSIDKLPKASIDAISATSTGEIWFVVGTRAGHIGVKGDLEFLPNAIPASGETVVAVIQDGKQRLWVRTARHLFRLNPLNQQFEPEAVDGLPPANDVGLPALTRAGNLMIPTVAGLFRYVNEKWQVLDRSRGLNANSVLSALEDREGGILIGLGGAGLRRWEGRYSWSGWTESEGLPDNVVWSVLRDSRERLWVGTNNGLAMWDAAKGQWRIWRERDGLDGFTVRQLTQAEDGSIWVLCYPGGVTRFDSETLQPERVPTPEPDPNSMQKGPDGRIWLASSQYLKVLRSPEKPYIWNDVPVPPEAAGSVTNLKLSPDSVLWSGGSQGLARFDGLKWQHFTTRDGLRSNSVLEIAPVSGEEVWFRYRGALGLTQLRLVGGKPVVAHFDHSSGLPNDDVYMLGRDRQGNIWAGGPQGVTAILPGGGMRHYTQADGLLWNDTSEGGFWAESDGTLLFGTSGGLARFDPARVPGMTTPPPVVVLTSARLAGKDHLQELSPEVPSRENTLRAEFSVLSFRDPASVRCRYRLDGLESDFTETQLRELRYPALRPGKYELQLSCQSAAGVESAPVRFAFVITPAWWQKWYVYAAGLILAGVSIGAIIWLRTFKLTRDRARLEKAVAERSAELAKLNEELREASLTDPLTGARNRRYFELTIDGDACHAVRSYAADDIRNRRNRDVIFYLVDVDHFKQVNDTYGHDAGDDLLVEVTRRIETAIRQSDILIRWGGEEFLIVSRYTERAEAMALASRVLKAIGGEPFLLRGVSEPVLRTCSIGWAAFPWFRSAAELVSYDVVMEVADRALYAAKQGGRNRAVGLVPLEEEASASSSPLRANELQADDLARAPLTLCGPGLHAQENLPLEMVGAD